MKLFSERYDFELDWLDENTPLISPVPEEDIYNYCKYVTMACKMENEIPIICLVYLERLLTKTGILITDENWKRLCLISLCIGSKIWDDDSLENIHFPKVMADVNITMINKLEQAFLEFLNYDLVVKGSEYAKYYFILRTLAEELKLETHKKAASPQAWGEFPLRAPISALKMQELQQNSAKAEVYLKEVHSREISEAVLAKFKDHGGHLGATM